MEINYIENFESLETILPNSLILGDCLEVGKKIEDSRVDIILTDLPYGTVKTIKNVKHGMSNNCEWDTVIETSKVMELSNQKLRKNGKLILFAQQPFTTELINASLPNLTFNYNMIWEKDHFANALTAKKAPVNYYEDVLVFSKKHETVNNHPLREYFKIIFELINVPKKLIIEKIGQSVEHSFRFDSAQFSICTEKTYNKLIKFFNINKFDFYKPYTELQKIDSKFKSTFNLWEGLKYKSNILKYKKDYQGLHPAQKPILLLEDLLKTFSDVNDLCVDLTCGSASTPVACINTNRKFIGIEKELKFYNISKNRIKNHISNQTNNIF